MATAYMARYGATPETLMRVGMKNHDNGALNDKAQFGATIRQVMDNKVAARPGQEPAGSRPGRTRWSSCTTTGPTR
jgi:acetyl-CoA acetyltransferase